MKALFLPCPYGCEVGSKADFRRKLSIARPFVMSFPNYCGDLFLYHDVCILSEPRGNSASSSHSQYGITPLALGQRFPPRDWAQLRLP
jgi:hypothetical protein